MITFFRKFDFVVFFWGVLWKPTNPIAAVIVLAVSPLIGLGCDWLYENVLNSFPFIYDTFGDKLNFLYRVFMIFIVGSILLVGLTKIFNQYGEKKVNDFDLEISLPAIAKTLTLFLLVELPFILLAISQIISPQIIAIPAGLACMVLFSWFIKKDKEKVAFYETDLFYAGLLTSAMVGIMFFFA